jgi:hypothetical protein
MIRSPPDASRAPAAPLRGRSAPPDPSGGSQKPAAIRAREHSEARPKTVTWPPRSHLRSRADAGKRISVLSSMPNTALMCNGSAPLQRASRLGARAAVTQSSCPAAGPGRDSKTFQIARFFVKNAHARLTRILPTWRAPISPRATRAPWRAPEPAAAGVPRRDWHPRRAVDAEWCGGVPGRPSKHGANIDGHWSRPIWPTVAG